jgi:hypothetical protein
MRIAKLLFVIPLLGCAHRKSNPFGELQSLTAVSFPGDSVVLARLRRQHPCVTRVPRPSRFSDITAPPKVCTLVETAIATIRDLNAAPEVLPDLREFRIDRVLCATVTEEAYRNDLTERVEVARWNIVFSSDEQPDVVVRISRLTGEAQAYKRTPELDVSTVDPCE